MNEGNRDPRARPRAVGRRELDETQEMLKGWSQEPSEPAGTRRKCPKCGGVLLTTNQLRRVIATPTGLVTLARLSGAECRGCGAQVLDPAAIAIVAEHEVHEIAADYETKVTRASGRTLGTYFKADLVRVLGLKGKEKLRWKVIDRNHAYVEIARG